MQATSQQIQVLERLQELDRARMQAQSELENMPQRQQVLEGRTKRKAVQAKLDQVAGMLASERSAYHKLADEDAKLEQRQAETQAKIDQAQGDYRQITSLTRDMQGMAKRRETLEFQMGKAKAKIAEVVKVHETATQAIDALDKREKELVQAHSERSTQLMEVVQAASDKRAQLASCLPEELLKAYSEAMQKCKGVGLSRLEGGKCSACRTPIDSDRMLQVLQEAPLATCPSCRRLLVVDEEES